MVKTLELLQENPSIEFRAAVARVAGMMDYEAQKEPHKTYTVAEIAELFDYLHELMQEKKENEPAGGNRTGSDT